MHSCNYDQDIVSVLLEQLPSLLWRATQLHLLIGGRVRTVCSQVCFSLENVAYMPLEKGCDGSSYTYTKVAIAMVEDNALDQLAAGHGSSR
jgi:hypothetical protein